MSIVGLLNALHLTVHIHSLSCTSWGPFAGQLLVGSGHKMALKDHMVGGEGCKSLPSQLQPSSGCHPPRVQVRLGSSPATVPALVTGSCSTGSLMFSPTLVAIIASGYGQSQNFIGYLTNCLQFHE